jgi:hypothetical protein
MLRSGSIGVAVVVAVVGLSDGAGAQEARPVRFWARADDVSVRFSAATRANSRRVPGSFVPTPVTGWVCVATEPQFVQKPASPADAARGLPAFAARTFETATLTCSSVSGKIQLAALCYLASDHQEYSQSALLFDPQDHRVMLEIACSNDP